MPQIVLMSWNIENFGDTKYKKSNGRAELIALIAEVMLRESVDIAAFLEMRGNRSAAIGNRLVTALDGATTAGRWSSQPSPQFVNKRQEQYLFVWDTQAITLYNAPNSFQYRFANPAPPPKGPLNIGFPRQVASDRPPYLGYFRTVTAPVIDVPTAVFHAPAPKYFPSVRDASQNLAAVTEFNNTANTCTVMGDFNVKSMSNPSVANSKGSQAFNALVAASFTQLIPGNATDERLTSLIAKGRSFPGMNFDDCYSQPYDNFFQRVPNPNPRNVRDKDAGLEDLLQECVGANYLGPFLKALHDRRTGNLAPASYATVEAAFEPFRRYVSDHMPVVTRLKWT